MSLSPFDSFQSRFVTYLLNFPRMKTGSWTTYNIMTMCTRMKCMTFHRRAAVQCEGSLKIQIFGGWGRLVRSSNETSSSVSKTFRSRKCQTLSQPRIISHSQTFLHQTTTNCNTVPTLGTNSSSTVGLSRLSYAIVKLKPTASGETQAADEAENGTSSRRVTTIRNIKLFWTQKRN